MPVGYVRALFDAYAADFDDALTGGLRYRGPDMLLYAVARACGGGTMRIGKVLDLGCGTGLAGAAFRPFCARLTGVDRSPGMLAEARGKRLYDELVEAEAMAYLRAEAERDAACDLILAADVLIYFRLGGLEPVILDPASARTEKGVAVPGLVVVARKAG
ncbi:MAG: methyltransferase domain-containing protein [Pseudolabrys sp.]